MSGSEYYSKCPNCGKPALSKYDSSGYGFRFDACPHCMFLYYTDGANCPTTLRVDVWSAILSANELTLKTAREQLSVIPNDRLNSTVFSYSTTSESEMNALTKLGGEKLFEFSRKAYLYNYNHSKPSVRFFERQARKEACCNLNDCIPF
ncbi:hypothetical protein [Vibrio metschnikovii]|uniref:Uncharacterized protein n=1 Tax=Vibrio metschnikovii TaxID=28172 RepID=A0A9X0RB99_VIBME|nr:hypothetical protein [Vibrio metschnikovii]MBC5853222.1 hypothetical protein [Vibrio metschnikovii]